MSKASRRRKRGQEPPGWAITKYDFMNDPNLPAWQCQKVVDGRILGMWGLPSRKEALRVAWCIHQGRNPHPYFYELVDKFAWLPTRDCYGKWVWLKWYRARVLRHQPYL